MKRRKFLKNIGKLSSAPIVLNGLGMSTLLSPAMLEMLTTCDGVEDRTLVVLFLKGGNDGLNTIIPVDQYSTYIGHRPTIGIPETGTGAYINLDTTLDVADQVGIHPSIESFKDMYESGKARMIQAVGYPDFNQSHFKSTDLWLGGGDGTPGGTNGSGWVGRFFENAYPGIHGSPNDDFPDPLGIQFGDTKASLGYHDCSSVYQAVNLTGQYPGNLYGLLNGLGTAPHTNIPDSEFGEEIQYIMDVENSTNVYGQRITDVFNAGTNSSTVYPDGYLSYQLSLIARLLSGGSQTKMFMAHRGGFDTHVNQVEEGSTHTGEHANNIADVFDSIKAFHNDLTNLGLGNKVVTVVFSEFSRRITENGNTGTDHGNYGPMFLFGDAVNPGISGTNFDLTAINDSGNMDASEMQFDYRDVLKSVLQNWMGAGTDILDPTLLSPYAVLPNLILDDQTVDPSCYIIPTAPLSVELTFFNAYLTEEKQVKLDWETASEINSDYFEIERMKEDIDPEFVARVNAQGTSSFSQTYEALDSNPLSGVSYYRLRSVDLDGSEQFSDWKAIELEQTNIENIRVYPNPAIYDFNLVLTTKINRKANLELFSINGQLVYSEALNIKEGFNKFRVDVTNIPIGQYFVKLTGDGLEVETMKVLIQRK